MKQNIFEKAEEFGRQHPWWYRRVRFVNFLKAIWWRLSAKFR